jgi:TetR/AcrR family transcriptional regulator, tetracycline repressor protein
MGSPMKEHPQQPTGGTARAIRERTPGQRAGLTREEVLAAALGIAEAAGLEQLSIRKIAGELGVAPNAIYTYFADKTALLDALFDATLAAMEGPEPGSASWKEELSELMRESRALILSRPYLASLYISRPGGPNAIRLGESALRMLERGGVAGPAAVAALRALLTYTIGFAAMEVPRLAEPDRGTRIGERLKGMSTEEYTATRGLVGPLSTHPGDAEFESGLRWMLKGIESEAAPGGGSGGTGKP